MSDLQVDPFSPNFFFLFMLSSPVISCEEKKLSTFDGLKDNKVRRIRRPSMIVASVCSMLDSIVYSYHNIIQ
jgi:hypothetical protein